MSNIVPLYEQDEVFNFAKYPEYTESDLLSPGYWLNSEDTLSDGDVMGFYEHSKYPLTVICENGRVLHIEYRAKIGRNRFESTGKLCAQFGFGNVDDFGPVEGDEEGAAITIIELGDLRAAITIRGINETLGTYQAFNVFLF